MVFEVDFGAGDSGALSRRCGEFDATPARGAGRAPSPNTRPAKGGVTCCSDSVNMEIASPRAERTGLFGPLLVALGAFCRDVFSAVQ
jgi:hypothetical protein